MPSVESSNSSLHSELVQLAAEKSSEKRLELLRRITDAYLEQDDYRSSTQRFLFDELITDLIDKIDNSGRAQASSHLSRLPEMPDVVADRLATDDDIAVARPIVRDYRGLREKTLIQVAKTGSQEHLRAIAGRSVVAPSVSRIVVDRGDRTTVRAIAGNSGAQFCSDGMNQLIGKAETDDALQTLIVDRRDLTLESIGKLLPLISQELAARLQAKQIEFNQAVIDDHIGEWVEERKKNVARIDAYIKGIQDGNLVLNDVIGELTKGQRLVEAVTVIAAIIDLDPDYAFRQVTKGELQSVLLLLKAANLSWPAVDSILKLRRSKMFAEYSPVTVTKADYDAIDGAMAQRVVRFMKVRRTATSGLATAS